jgi:hypothetical protein
MGSRDRLQNVRHIRLTVAAVGKWRWGLLDVFVPERRNLFGFRARRRAAMTCGKPLFSGLFFGRSAEL